MPLHVLPRQIRQLLWRFVWTGLCASAMTGSAWAAGIKILVSTTPLSTPFYVAEEQGYFRDEGLEVTLVDWPSGSVCLKQLLDGQGQLATASDQAIMFLSFEKPTFKVLASFASSRQDVKLVARRSAAIRSVADMKDKRVAMVRGAAGQYVFDLAMLTSGLDPRSAQVVDLDLQQLEAAATNRSIDAFALWQPGANHLIKLLGTDALVLPGPNLYTLTFNLTALRDARTISAEDCVKALRALERALVFLRSEPSKAKTILRDRLKLVMTDIDGYWPDYRFELGLNQSLIATLESTARWAMRENLVKHRDMPNYLDFIDIGPLKRVRPAAVTVVK
jgi:ABC-type nitrate/sulfonate/bicarbonate transport system substrate-binding protein